MPVLEIITLFVRCFSSKLFNSLATVNSVFYLIDTIAYSCSRLKGAKYRTEIGVGYWPVLFSNRSNIPQIKSNSVNKDLFKLASHTTK